VRHLPTVILSLALLSGCSLVYGLYDRERMVILTPLDQITDCGAVEGTSEPHVHYFEGAHTVTAWVQRHGIPASRIDPSIEGPFALVEVGELGRQGTSVLVSRDAVLHSGARLVLESTFFQAPGLQQTQGSPCVLLALPPQHYSSIELYDQEGALRAQTTTREEYEQ
jgi:hypothetical protein